MDNSSAWKQTLQQWFSIVLEKIYKLFLFHEKNNGPFAKIRLCRFDSSWPPLSVASYCIFYILRQNFFIVQSHEITLIFLTFTATLTLPSHFILLWSSKKLFKFVIIWFYLQSWSWYFETIWCLTKLSFHHNWSEPWLLVINIL